MQLYPYPPDTRQKASSSSLRLPPHRPTQVLLDGYLPLPVRYCEPPLAAPGRHRHGGSPAVSSSTYSSTLFYSLGNKWHYSTGHTSHDTLTHLSWKETCARVTMHFLVPFSIRLHNWPLGASSAKSLGPRHTRSHFPISTGPWGSLSDNLANQCAPQLI